MIELESMAIALPMVEGHPNRMPFHGVLTVVDVASERPPSGARGHVVLLTKAAAESALPSLMGMALDYTPSLDRHDVRRKVGVITKAEIVGRNVELGGHLFAKDFPEIVEEIEKSERIAWTANREDSQTHTRDLGDIRNSEYVTSQPALGSSVNTFALTARESALKRAAIVNSTLSGRELSGGRPYAGGGSGGAVLGMSYEIADARVIDTKARVWTLTRVTFTGAAILRRDKAAYRDTWIELGE